MNKLLCACFASAALIAPLSAIADHAAKKSADRLGQDMTIILKPGEKTYLDDFQCYPSAKKIYETARDSSGFPIALEIHETNAPYSVVTGQAEKINDSISMDLYQYPDPLSFYATNLTNQDITAQLSMQCK